MPKNSPLHPASARTLRDLVALHGIPAILDALTEIGVKEAWIKPYQFCTLRGSEPHRVSLEGPTPESDPVGRFRVRED